jgi:hypothetical protein
MKLESSRLIQQKRTTFQYHPFGLGNFLARLHAMQPLSFFFKKKQSKLVSQNNFLNRDTKQTFSFTKSKRQLSLVHATDVANKWRMSHSVLLVSTWLNQPGIHPSLDSSITMLFVRTTTMCLIRFSSELLVLTDINSNHFINAASCALFCLFCFRFVRLCVNRKRTAQSSLFEF